MRKALDLIEQRFGRLTVLFLVNKRTRDGRVQWFCQCDCGNTCQVTTQNLRNGHTKSCGCLQKETRVKNGKAKRIHGMWNTPEYNAFRNMWQRCINPKCKSYPRYGGRGITISPEFRSFEAWFEYIGPRPGPGFSQDRIENSKGYLPGNIHWATAKKQARNRRPILFGPRKQFWFCAWRQDQMCQFMSNNQSEFAKKYGLNPAHISACLRGKRKQHKSWSFQRI